MTLAAGRRLGAYEVIAPLGAGGMGEVYRAHDARLDREVAIKVLPARLSADAVALSRFEREAKAVAALSHPGILSIFDFGSQEGVAYAVMELLEGKTLRDLLADGPLPTKKAIEYAIQIAEALAAAHDKGIIHRDLKPTNLFVTRDDRIKILDFGLARQTVVDADGGSSPTVSQHTDPGTVLGTVPYMSPEQVRAEPAGPASDIFSFGIVLYEMLAGRRAFDAPSAAETMNAILKEDPPDLLAENQELPPQLELIVRHCLEKRPDQRFHSAHDVAFALEHLSLDSGTRSVRSRAAIPAAPLRDRRAVVAAALLVAGLAAGIVADRLWRRAPAAEPPTFRRLTFDRGSLGASRFAPEGNTIVYNAAWRGGSDEIFTTRLDGRESRPFGLSGVLFSVSSRSELAVSSNYTGLGAGGTLARVPLSGGAPREVLEGVTWADWAPDGADLAVVRVLDGSTRRIEFPIGKTIYETRDNVTHLRVAPGGEAVAFVHHLPDDNYGAGSVLLVDRNGTTRALSEGWSELFGLAWRPDGREVWFSAARRGEIKALRGVTMDGRERLVLRLPGMFDVEDVARDGRVLLTQHNFRIEMMALPPGAARERDLTWLGLSSVADLSSDGRRVLFTELPIGAGAGGQTYMRPTDGTPAVRLGEGSALALSPDGKWALSQLTSPSRLMVLPTGVGVAKALANPGLTYLGWGTWFPDSRRVAFTARSSDGEARAYAQEIGGPPRPIGPPGIGRVVVAPDGRTLAAVARDGAPVLVSAESAESRPAPGLQGGDLPVRWSSDGRALFFIRHLPASTEVHRADLATGRPSLLATLAAEDTAGASVPGTGPGEGFGLTPDGKAHAYSLTRTLSDLYLVEGLK